MTDDIFKDSNYDVDNFLLKHKESRNLTKDEIKSIKALYDTAIRFNFGNNIILGPEKYEDKTCIFKTTDSLWIVWKSNEKNKYFEPDFFNNSLDACIDIIKRNSKKTNVILNFLKILFSQAILDTSLNNFAKKTNYTYNKVKRKTSTT